MCDIVVDAIGIGAIAQQSIDLLVSGGTLLLFGHNGNAVATIRPSVIVENELVLMGTYCTHHTFPTAIKLLQNPVLELERLVCHKHELWDILIGIALLKTQKASSVILYQWYFDA